MTVDTNVEHVDTWQQWPGYFDPAVSLAATWDVWLSTGASAAQVQRLARRRLQGLVALARERSPFYRELYAGVSAAPAGLLELPVVTKRALMAQLDASLTDPALTSDRIRGFLADTGRAGHALLDRYAVWTSSGSTGEPGIYVHDRHALAVYEALQVIRFRHLQSPALLAAAFLAGDRYAFVGATGGHFAGNASVLRLRVLCPWLADRLRTFSILEPGSALVRQLNDYQPTLLAAYPTAAALLADEQQGGRLAIRPREIWTGGETLSSMQRSRIAGTFGCVVRDDYGASEFLSIAWSCSYGALHLNADWIVLEPVDEHYRPVPAGVASHTALLTNLANRVQPLIRYDLGDSVTWVENACPCGSRLPVIRVEGRSDDVLALSGPSAHPVKLLPLALTTVLEDEAGIYRFQLLQSGSSALRLRLEPQLPDADSMRCQQVLVRYLQSQGLSNAGVEIERAPLQPHPLSGKLRRVLAGR